MVFNPYFFVVEKPLPVTRTCTVVNFHHLHSLLGQFSSLVFEQTESSDQCWFVVKKIAFSERYKGKMKISRRRKGQLVDPCCGLSVIFCGFISHLIGRKTINIPEIFSGVHGFTEKTKFHKLFNGLESMYI